MDTQKHVETLNEYLRNYPSDLPFTEVDLDTLRSDGDTLDHCIDFIIGLFAKIGLTENMAPTMDGIRLDACLEFLSDIRKI